MQGDYSFHRQDGARIDAQVSEQSQERPRSIASLMTHDEIGLVTTIRRIGMPAHDQPPNGARSRPID